MGSIGGIIDDGSCPPSPVELRLVSASTGQRRGRWEPIGGFRTRLVDLGIRLRRPYSGGVVEGGEQIAALFDPIEHVSEAELCQPGGAISSQVRGAATSGRSVPRSEEEGRLLGVVATRR